MQHPVEALPRKFEVRQVIGFLLAATQLNWYDWTNKAIENSLAIWHEYASETNQANHDSIVADRYWAMNINIMHINYSDEFECLSP